MSAAPPLADGFLEPVLGEVSVVEHEDLESAVEVGGHVAHQLKLGKRVCAIFVRYLRFSLIRAEERLRGLIEHQDGTGQSRRMKCCCSESTVLR